MSFSFGFCVDDEGKQVSDEISLATQNATRVGKDQQLPARELNFEDVVRSLQAHVACAYARKAILFATACAKYVRNVWGCSTNASRLV